MKTLILGHRGSMGDRPENTAAAFKKALSDDADGIEFDVHLTKDGVPVVIHDESVDRTTDGSGLIKDMSLEEVKELRIINENGDLTTEQILTLEETLDISVTDSKLMNIELKQGPIMYPGMEGKVIETVKKYGIIDKVIISSFNHYSIKMIKNICPELKCGLLYMAGLYQPWTYANQLEAEAIHPFFASILPEIVQGCHQNRVLVNVFGANNRNTIAKMLEINVDCIITNYPGIAVELRDKKEAIN